MCQIKEVQLHAGTFKMMHNLRILQFYKSKSTEKSKVHIPSFLESLPDALQFLCWDGFPQRSLPLDFLPANLVKLDMHNSQLEQLWERDQHLPNLKRLDLSGSKSLVQIPDLSQSPNIEEIILSHCVSLVQVYSSSFLKKLNCLWLNGCIELRSLNLASNILSKSSGLIVLYDCCNLEMFSINNITIGAQLYGCSRSRSIESIFRNSLPGEIFSCFRDTRPRSLFEKFSDTFDPMDSDDLDEKQEAIKEIPSSLEYLVGLQTLRLNLCKELEFLPNSIGNVTLLTKLDFSGCDKLSEIPSDIGHLSSLRELSLHESGVVNLPDSIAHLSSLKSLDLSDCKRLEFIPELPPFLEHLLAFDCPSIRRVSSSRFQILSDSKEGVFKFHLTNSQELDPSAQSNLVTDASLRITDDAYRFTFESDDGIHIIPSNDQLRYYFNWKGRQRFIVHDHTFLWKYYLDSSSITQMLSHAHNFTFEICKYDVGSFWPNYRPTFKVKECGISPLYAKDR
ncbi:Leucine-rich repeat [Sesbania bispinosa]|nr:Leucine-rich repeat [Sesbania bispinosa]